MASVPASSALGTPEPVGAGLCWDAIKHPSLPAPGTKDVRWDEWLLEHADETLLFNGIADIPILSDEAAAALSKITGDLIGKGGDGVGSMHNYGTDLLVHTAFARLIDDMIAALEPIIDLLFFTGATSGDAPEAGANPKRLACHSAHSIGYGMQGQREKKLQLHVDDSKITINVCLGDAPFTGSDLYFTGQQPILWPAMASLQRKKHAAGAGGEAFELLARPRPGRAMIHLGAHPHRTVPIQTGERKNWVLWYHCKEEAGGAAHAHADADSAVAGGAGAAPGAGDQ